jgi:hypothetical protein
MKKIFYILISICFALGITLPLVVLAQSSISIDQSATENLQTTGGAALGNGPTPTATTFTQSTNGSVNPNAANNPSNSATGGAVLTTPTVTSNLPSSQIGNIIPTAPAAPPPSTPTPTCALTGGNLCYTPLEPIPGITTTDLTNPNSLPAIVNAIFKILITVGALMAVLTLTIGGIQYMVSGSAATKSGGIKRAKAALWAIVLIAASWLILNTINPTLLNFSLNPCPQGDVGCTVTAAPNSNTPANNTNTSVGVSSTAADVANSIQNSTPSASECNDVELAVGAKGSQGQLPQVNGVSNNVVQTWYYTLKAALWDTSVLPSDTNQPITDMINAGAAAYNNIVAADNTFVSKCNAAGY